MLARRGRKFEWLIYIASFAFPFLGIAYGTLEICKPEAARQRRGKLCLALGVAALVFVCAGATAWMAFGLKTDFGFLWPG